MDLAAAIRAKAEALDQAAGTYEALDQNSRTVLTRTDYEELKRLAEELFPRSE